MTSETKASKDDRQDYFKMVNPIWPIIEIPCIAYVFVLAYLPSYIPYESMGAFGSFSKNLSSNHIIIPILM